MTLTGWTSPADMDLTERSDIQECPGVATLCSATLISEEIERASYVKHRLWGPRQLSCNTHYQPINWPEYTTVCCGYDHQPINGLPVPLPVKYLKKEGKWVVWGAFCSPSCAFSKLLEQEQDSYNFSSRLEMFLKMLRSEYGVTGNVWCSPDLYCLDTHGGHMSLEEFRQGSTAVTVLPVRPPFLSCCMVFEEVACNKPVAVPDTTPKEFETLPQDSLRTTPANNKSMVFKIRGMRVPARKKQADSKPVAAQDSFNQSEPLYVKYLDQKKKKTATTRRTKTAKPAPRGNLMDFIQKETQLD